MTEEAERVTLKAAKDMDGLELSELVDRLVREHCLSLKEAVRTVYTLWKRGALDLQEPHPSFTLLRYAVSLESLWFWVTTAFVALVFLLVFYAHVAPLVYARYAAGVVFVLYLPGFVLIEALYPRREDLESIVRLALSFGLSLAVVPLIGLVLNYTPWGIRLEPILVSLAAYTEAMCLAALVRRHGYYRLGLRGEAAE